MADTTVAESIAEPIAEPEVRDDATPDEKPIDPGHDCSGGPVFYAGGTPELNDAIDRFLQAMEGAFNPNEATAYLRGMIDDLEENGATGPTDDEPEPADPERSTATNGNGTPPTAKISLDSPWWRLGNVFRDLGRDACRLEAAQTLIASGEPDGCTPLDGSDACAVEHIVRQIAEHLEAYRLVIAEVQRHLDVPKPTSVTEPADAPPEWSDARWPEFQAFIAGLPGFPKGKPFDKLLEGTNEAISELVDDIPDWGWLRAKMDLVAKHLSGPEEKGAAA